MKLNKKLLNHIVVCMFALSAGAPISAMTALRSGALVRALARHSSLATTRFARMISTASQATPQKSGVLNFLMRNAAELTTPLAARNFRLLSRFEKGQQLLNKILTHNTNASQSFLQSMVMQPHRFRIPKGYSELINSCVQGNLESTQSFIPAVYNPKDEHPWRSDSGSLIYQIMEKNPEAIKLFTPIAIHEFELFCQNGMQEESGPSYRYTDCGWMTRYLMEKDSGAVKLFAPIFKKHCRLLCNKDLNSSQILIDAMAQNIDVCRELIPFIVKNVDAWYTHLTGCDAYRYSIGSYQFPHQQYYLLRRIYENDTLCSMGVSEILTQAACDNIVDLFASKAGRLFLEDLIKIDSMAVAKILANPKSQNFEKKIKAYSTGTIDDSIRVLRLKLKSAQGEPLSQSEVHMLMNAKKVVLRRMEDDLLQLQDVVIRKEHALIDAGNTVFYHAQKSDKIFPKMVDELLGDKKLDSFLYMHTHTSPAVKKIQKMIVENNHTKSDTLDMGIFAAMRDWCQSESLERERILKKGRQTVQDRQRMLFLNAALNGNIDNEGSQSFPAYFANNWNAAGVYEQSNTILKDVFVAHGCAELYEQYKEELVKLHREYMKLSKYGTLYQIAIPESKINKMVMPVFSGGGKRFLAINGEETDDMQKISAAMRDASNHPGDRTEFVAIMTYDEHGLMNPKCGAKIYSYMIPNNDAQHAAWQAKWEDVKSRIKAAQQIM